MNLPPNLPPLLRDRDVISGRGTNKNNVTRAQNKVYDAIIEDSYEHYAKTSAQGKADIIRQIRSQVGLFYKKLDDGTWVVRNENCTYTAIGQALRDRIHAKRKEELRRAQRMRYGSVLPVAHPTDFPAWPNYGIHQDSHRGRSSFVSEDSASESEYQQLKSSVNSADDEESDSESEYEKLKTSVNSADCEDS